MHLDSASQLVAQELLGAAGHELCILSQGSVWSFQMKRSLSKDLLSTCPQQQALLQTAGLKGTQEDPLPAEPDR